MTVTVLLNARAGSVEDARDAQVRRIIEAFQQADVVPEVCFVEPEKLNGSGAVRGVALRGGGRGRRR